jgi:predicted nucleic acid-binding protein
MPTLLDSNILMRFQHRASPDYAEVRRAVRVLYSSGETLCYTSQNLGEFWNVCTRPATARGGFGLTLAETDRRAQRIERLFRFLPDSEAVHREWRRLLVVHAVQGRQVHDTRIAAAMAVHGVNRILTFNTADFDRFPFLSAVHPKDV